MVLQCCTTHGLYDSRAASPQDVIAAARSAQLHPYVVTFHLLGIASSWRLFNKYFALVSVRPILQPAGCNRHQRF